MNDLRTAAQQALEALEADNSKLWPSEKRTTAIAALRAALAQQAEPEPLPPEQRQRWEELAAMPQQAEPRNQCGETCERAKLCATCAQVLAQQAEGGGNLPPPLQAEPTGKQPLQVESVAAVAENATTQQRVVEAPPSDYRRGYWDGFNIGKREGRIEAEDAAKQAEPVEPVAKVELMMTGGNAGLATRIVEIENHLRERLRPGQQLYIAPPPPQRKPLTEEVAALTAQRDALLEALKLARSVIGHPDDAHSQMIDAAIKAVESK